MTPIWRIKLVIDVKLSKILLLVINVMNVNNDTMVITRHLLPINKTWSVK